jgi:hypothetical protein
MISLFVILFSTLHLRSILLQHISVLAQITFNLLNCCALEFAVDDPDPIRVLQVQFSY